MSELSEALMQKLNTELRAGEKTVWAAQPIAEKMMKSGFVIWFFFIPWTLFAVFWIAGASGFKWPDFGNMHGFDWFPLFGVPFLLIGLGGLFSPFWLARKATNTVYAITNQRLLICVFGKTTDVKAFYAKDVTYVNRIEKSDGSGDLYFSSEHYRDSDGDSRTKREGFSAVRNVKNVEKLVENFVKANQIKS